MQVRGSSAHTRKQRACQSLYPAAPCRGFERAYVALVNVSASLHLLLQQRQLRGMTWAPFLVHPQESPVASKIKDAFMGDKGLAGSVRELPFPKIFELPHVKTVRAARRMPWQCQAAILTAQACSS